MGNYTSHPVNNFVSICSFYSVYLFELAGINVGKKESHNYPEILYVMKGTHELYIDDVQYNLAEGQMIIYAPNATHYGMYQNSTVAVVSFALKEDSISPIYNKAITLTLQQREAISKIISLGTEIFVPISGEGSQTGMALKHGTTDSHLQILKNLTELFLIDVFESTVPKTDLLADTQEDHKVNLLSVIVDYMKSNITADISLQTINKEFRISTSTLKNLFKSKYNLSPKAYFINLKIEEAKRMIRETSLNFTEISSHLNFSSVHYFSKLFKKKTGLTPSEYAKSNRKSTQA